MTSEQMYIYCKLFIAVRCKKNFGVSSMKMATMPKTCHSPVIEKYIDCGIVLLSGYQSFNISKFME